MERQAVTVSLDVEFHTGYKVERGGLSLQFTHVGFFFLPHVRILGELRGSGRI